MTVHPLPLDDELNVRPLDLDACDPDERAGIEAALARLANGTAVLVPQEEVEAEIVPRAERGEPREPRGASGPRRGFQ